MGLFQSMAFPPIILRRLSLLLILVAIQTPAKATSAPSDSARLQAAAQLLEQGNLAQAESEARKLLTDAYTRPFAYALLGSIRLTQKNYAESASFFEKALQFNPRLIGSYISLGNVYALQGKPALAAEQFRNALKLDPGNSNARFALAQLETQSGHFAASLRLATPMLSDLSRCDYGLVLLASDYLGQSSDHDHTASLLQDWSALPNPAPAESLAFAEVFASHHRLDQAASILQAIQNRNGGFFELYLALGNYNLQSGFLPSAATEFRLALDAHENCSRCLYELARISEQQANLDEALSYALRAKQIDSGDPDILFEVGRLCLKKDLYDDAIENLSAAHRLRSETTSFEYVLASAYTGKKDYKAAIPLLQHLLHKNPGDAMLTYSLGAVQFLNSDLLPAEHHLRASVAADANQIAAYYYLGLTENGEGKTQEATRTLQSILDHHPDHAPTLIALGGILSGERKYPEARILLERATQLDAASVKGHYQLGMVLARLGQSEASQKEFAIVKSLNKQKDVQNDLQIFSSR